MSTAKAFFLAKKPPTKLAEKEATAKNLQGNWTYFKIGIASHIAEDLLWVIKIERTKMTTKKTVVGLRKKSKTKTGKRICGQPI